MLWLRRLEFGAQTRRAPPVTARHFTKRRIQAKRVVPLNTHSHRHRHRHRHRHTHKAPVVVPLRGSVRECVCISLAAGLSHRHGQRQTHQSHQHPTHVVAFVAEEEELRKIAVLALATHVLPQCEVLGAKRRARAAMRQRHPLGTAVAGATTAAAAAVAAFFLPRAPPLQRVVCFLGARAAVVVGSQHRGGLRWLGWCRSGFWVLALLLLL